MAEAVVARKVLVAGASGLVGNAAVRRFAADGWEVIGVSRRVPAPVAGATLVSVDLTSAEACAQLGNQLGAVTHFVYAAASEEPGLVPGWFDDQTIARNAAMLRNLFGPLSAAAGHGLRHVSLIQGTKAYGVHLPEFQATASRLPLREDAPRVSHRNFYFKQEDYLRERQASAGWGLTIFRPTVVYGEATGVSMNPVPPLLVYAALLRDDGELLHRPWAAAGPQFPVEAVDAGLIAEALIWAATAPGAHGKIFNLTNGDVFFWEGVWPAIADAFGMEVGGHHPVSFAKDVYPRADDWARIVDYHHLTTPAELEKFVGRNSFVYADSVIGAGVGDQRGAPLLNSTISVRLAGFHNCMHTDAMFRRLIRRMQEARMYPAHNHEESRHG